MIKKWSILLVFAVLLSISIEIVDAKRLLPRAAAAVKQASPSKTGSKSTTKGVTTSVKFRGDRRAVIATITNLDIASSISYTLTYDTNGTTQGAGGSIDPNSQSPITREILFGSCSHGVCRYDTNIKNAKLVITTTLKSGKKVSKSFRLKV